MTKGFGIKESKKNNSGKKANFLPLLDKMMEAGSKNKLQTFLQDNVDEINENLLYNFRNWTRSKLSTINRKEIKEKYCLISLISQTIHKFYLGNRAINLEIAITGYEFVSAIFTQQRNFKEKLLWAGNLCNLSLAYIDRIHGNRSENLEKAITVCQQALTINLRQVYPKLWADIQNNLGGAYKQRIIGEKSENIEQAIKHFKAALEVFTYSKFPSEWAKLQANLGNTYLEKLMGDRAENLEVAIELIETSLQVYTKDKFPQEWANTQNSLAGAYHERIRGDRAENLEKSIFYCKNALEVFTPKKIPQFWVETQMNLASAYRDRIDGNKAENLRLAIEIYQFILPVAREGFPSQWACIQNNLGIAYSKINHPEAQEKAIAAFEAALQIYNRETFPRNWAMAQKNLGLLYSERCYGERTENLEKAITYYQAAFQTFSLDAFPNYWAKNQNNLAIAYTKLDKIDKAIACCRSALKVFTPDAFPVECFTAARQFGEIAARTKRWSESIEGYGIAIEAIEISRSWTIYDFRRQKIVEQAFDVYHNMVQACINAGQLDKAIETVERSRSKRLVDLMASNDLYSDGEITPEVQELLHQYEALQKQIDSERFGNDSESNRGFMETGSRTQDRATFQAYNEAIDILETQKDRVFQKIRRLDPVLAGEIQVSAPDFARMQKLIDPPTTAILSFYTTTENTYIFILRQNQSTPDLYTCEGQGIETLQNWISQNWLQPYCNDKDTWQSQLGDFLAELAQRLQIDNLIGCYLQGIEELILIPHLLLHQIPLAALPIQDTEDSYLGDKFLIRYVPSCQVLEFCQERENRHPIGDSLNYGIVADATEDLACASFEAEQIADLFNIPESQHLKGRSQATKSNYRQLASRVQVLHSCHHAESRLDKPLESILKLADGTLTLGELLTPGWRLPNLLDVFLSCCETNLVVPESLADEILTLSTGFLCAGARSVISTLWSVDDLATALFSILYYQHRQEGKSRPEALQQAQKKLRSLTQEDIKSLSQKVQTKRQEARKQRNQHQPGSADYLRWDGEYRKYAGVAIQIEKVRTAPNYEPFSHPRYWAAFTCSGLR